MKIYTIGHGRGTALDVRDKLDQHGIELLVDVRSYPASRRNPSVNRRVFERAFGKRYLWLGDHLGGLHEGPIGVKIRRNWPAGIARLLKLAETTTLAVMCSETRPEDCHRGMDITPDLYDAAFGRPLEVIHILGDGSLRLDRTPRQQTLL